MADALPWLVMLASAVVAVAAFVTVARAIRRQQAEAPGRARKLAAAVDALDGALRDARGHPPGEDGLSLTALPDRGGPLRVRLAVRAPVGAATLLPGASAHPAQRTGDEHLDAVAHVTPDSAALLHRLDPALRQRLAALAPRGVALRYGHLRVDLDADTDAAVVVALADELVAVGRALQPAEPRLDGLARRATDDPDPDVRARALLALATATRKAARSPVDGVADALLRRAGADPDDPDALEAVLHVDRPDLVVAAAWRAGAVGMPAIVGTLRDAAARHPELPGLDALVEAAVRRLQARAGPAPAGRLSLPEVPDARGGLSEATGGGVSLVDGDEEA